MASERVNLRRSNAEAMIAFLSLPDDRRDALLYGAFGRVQFAELSNEQLLKASQIAVILQPPRR